MSSIKPEEVCLWGLLSLLPLLNLELFFDFDVFSFSDPSSGLLLFFKSFCLQFHLLRFCCISHATCTWELDFGFCRLLYVDGWFFCFEDAGSLCRVCRLWLLSCSGVFPRFNAVVDVDMGILLLVLDFQVMLYLNVNCLCWAWNQKLSSSVFLLVNWGKFCLLVFQISAAYLAWVQLHFSYIWYLCAGGELLCLVSDTPDLSVFVSFLCVGLGMV